MFNNRFYLNQGFENAGYTYQLALANFWSSTESNSNYAYFHLGNDTDNVSSKTNTTFACAIKKF